MRVASSHLAGRVPEPIRACVRKLAASGGGAWLVGGPVRDLLLGKEPRDYDVATVLTPEQVAARLPDADLQDARYGTARLLTGGQAVSVTTLRADGAYGDHRHPDSVRFVTDPRLDAARRDFTVNALYYDLARGEVVDHVGGLPDLDRRLLRTVGEPDRRFAEDHLRLLRLVRFAARLGFAVDVATERAARAAAPGLQLLAAERVYRELTEVLTAEGRGAALTLLVDLGFAGVLLPEVAALRGVEQPPQFHPEGDVLRHTSLVLDAVPAGDAVLAWTAVLHDIGKPSTFRRADDRIRFDGHDVVSAGMARAVLTRLKAPRALIDGVAEVCRDHIRFAALPSMRPRRRERWMRSSRFRSHLAFHRADCLGSHGNLDVYDFAAAELARLPPEREPLVSGRDVLALGVPPGPTVGRLLARVMTEADEAPVAWGRARALARLRDFVAELRQGEDPDAR